MYKYQELSKEIFSKYSHKIDWCNPDVYKLLSDSFIRKHNERINAILLSEIRKTLKMKESLENSFEL